MVVVTKKNDFKKYKYMSLNGYVFKPRNKKIKNLTIINSDYVKKILSKKIGKDIKRATKTIKLMLKSNVTDINDCNMMIEEVNRVATLLEMKYMKYFSELEYFELVKSLYFLNMEITAKKKIINEE